MTPEVQNWIREFLQDMGEYRYPQPIVAKAISERQTSLNTWRKDGVLWGDGWEKNGRIMYTGAGVIAAGLMAELSWHFGPKAAADLVSERINWVFGLSSDGELSFLNKVFYSYRSRPGDVTVSLGDQKVVKEHDDTKPMLLYSTLEEIAERDLRHGSLVVFPVGALIAQWVLRVQSFMDNETTD